MYVGSRTKEQSARRKGGFCRLSCCIAEPAKDQANSQLPTRHERKAFAEFILGDFLIGLGTASADSDSNSESVGYLNLIDALTPTLVWFDFFHLEGLPVWFERLCLDTTLLRPNGPQ
jgi:hypothetical protein